MRILWLKSELLHPIDKGGKIRTYQMLRELKREHHITYLTLDDETGGAKAVTQAEEYCHEIRRVPHHMSDKFTPGFYVDLCRSVASPLPYTLMKYRSAAMREEISRACASGKFDIVVCDFMTPWINMAKDLPLPTLLFQHNVEAMIWKRYRDVEKNALKKAFFHSQWRKMQRAERTACHWFDRVVAVSQEDAETMRQDYGIAAVDDVPTGVDTAYFTPITAPKPEASAHNLVFVGSMDWLPNDDAMRFFIESCLPRIRQTLPSVTLTIVGRNPYPALVEISRRDPAIRVTGRVEDVRPFIGDASVYIVPIRIGGGTRLKIYEAMAMEMPAVSTTVGAEGLPVRAGEEILFADTPDEFADAVLRLFAQPDLAARLGAQAGRTVREKFGWNKVAQHFAASCEKAAAGHRLPRAAALSSDGTWKEQVCE